MRWDVADGAPEAISHPVLHPNFSKQAMSLTSLGDIAVYFNAVSCSTHFNGVCVECLVFVRNLSQSGSRRLQSLFPQFVRPA
jgi:hypothetical protein